MNETASPLALRRASLVDLAAAQRRRLAANVEPWRGPLSIADRGIAAARYLGRPYDLAFSPGDDAIYCSELVHLAYSVVGLTVGAWQPAGELGLAGPPVRRLLRTRWRRHPACRGAASLDACMPALAATPILTPASIAADPHLTVIGTSYATLP